MSDKYTFKLPIIFLVLIYLLTGCGGNSQNIQIENPTERQKAIEIISNYAFSSVNPTPTLQNYIDAGVNGIDSSNLTKFNQIVETLDAVDVDTTEELNALTVQLGININPMANAGPDLSTALSQSLIINGAANDSDGSIVSYQWKENSITLAETASFSYTANSLGAHTLTLTVTDDDGASDTDIMQIVVTDEVSQFINVKPMVNAGEDRETILNQNVIVTGIANDSDGSIVSYLWKENSFILAETDSFTYKANSVGTHVLTLTVTDNDGDSATDSILVLVTDDVSQFMNVKPVVNAGEDREVTLNQNIIVTGIANDSDGSIVSYQWAENSTVLAETASFTFIGNSLGPHTLTLTVIDDDGDSNTDTIKINVIDEVPLETIRQFFNYGQSLSIGSRASPSLSISQPYNNIMFNEGLRAGATNLVQFTPLNEGTSVESQSSSTANNIIRRIIEEDGTSLNNQNTVYLASNPGFGARKINQLSKGSEYYNTILTQAQAAKNIATELGKNHVVSFVTFLQGESNYSPPTPASEYASSLNTLITDLNSDIALITNQTSNFPLITYQIASHRFKNKIVPTVALGYLQASKLYENIHLSVPMYIFDYVDNQHTDNFSNQQIGQYFARTYKRIAIDKTNWKPLHPIEVKWIENVIEIKFSVPVQPLTLDTNWVSAEMNFGFDIWNDDFSSMLDIIESVKIGGVDLIRIVLSQIPPIGSHISYAFGRDSHNGFSGRVNGPRGNLRDSAGDNDSYFDNRGTLRRMDNYSVIFSDQKLN